MIGPYFSPQTRVLDLYAGTGAMGIEALSRGAGWADFVEQEPQSCEAIRENLERTGFQERGKVHCASVGQTLSTLVGSYGLVFVDPPYKLPVDPNLLTQLVERDLLEPEGQLVIERSIRTQDQLEHPSLHLEKQRRHGDTLVWVFTREDNRG